MEMTIKVSTFIKEIYKTNDFIPLHEPCFIGNEKKYLNQCIDSTFVSYLGEFVKKFEQAICDYTKAKYCISICNGTAALHIALKAVGVSLGDEVLTQALTFVATANAISYCGANSIFLDSSRKTMGLCPSGLEEFLAENTEQRDGFCVNKKTGKIIKACVPMHVFGHPVEIEEIVEICHRHNVKVVEDSAESLGSFYKGKHTGLFGDVGIFSFNGNKTVTCGGGGAVVTMNEEIAIKVMHLSTTAKVPHSWEYVHDEIGYNYRMPNLNAAVALAQMESLEGFVENKRELALIYTEFFKEVGIDFVIEKEGMRSNYWLNALVLKDRQEREAFLKNLNKQGVMCRPIWTLLHKLKPFQSCEFRNLDNAQYFEDRVVNIPSSVRKR